ncbi:esterase-like activity of phytase family protein [Pannus brasiliensis CCIBt3594]|uniref:Esterase-like activity of phytase family protein n=1 Tax=Pannus brasiliensis CCIBt3594 TaxID=1427578 RepID=A0AAW9QZ21_9CHRO
MLKKRFYVGVGGSLLLGSVLSSISPAFATSLAGSLVLPGDSTDLTTTPGANGNRLGFFSDLYYDRYQNVYYGLSDRGPGGGVYNYSTRVQKFTLTVDPNTGAISNFNIIQTILFTQNGNPFNGLNPLALNGNSGVLGRSFDPEGFVVAPNGNFYVSDEYGPSVYEFNPNGEFIRAFTIPDNILPRAGANLDYVATRTSTPALTTGRQDNRGFEGLAMTPDGSKLLAMLQDPLVNEGSSNDGRRSRNLRIVEFDTATGTSTKQYIYPLEDIAAINARIPGTANDFGATAQGRNIGISAIIALNNNEFLVLERDNRGLGVDTPTTSTILPIGSKRVYKIDISGATDASGISLANTNTFTGTPVSKTLFLDIQAALTGQIIPEKFEGLTVGPRLNDGTYAILAGNDNDYSVTQNGSNVQFNVCTTPDYTSTVQVAIDASCPTGFQLIPGFLYSFKTAPGELANFVPASTVPEPNTVAALLLTGSGLFLAKIKRERKAE